MKVIGLAPNPHKIESMQLAAKLADWLISERIRVIVPEDIAASMGRTELGATESAVSSADFLLVLGGDGTMLRWGRMAAPQGTPMMGVNFGQYGFITEIHPSEAILAMKKVLAGEIIISERAVLKATVARDGQEIGTYYALNDAVVSKGPFARMLGLHTYVNGKFIVTYTADGIIISTPTGSTAYSLSAGGPVVHPDVSVLIITPICPHTLNARALVIPDNETVQIIGECGDDPVSMMLTMDGQLGEHLVCNDKISIGKADFKAKLVQIEPQSFYNKLQKRLRWGERFNGQ
ncbi:MAG: NAD(+)/NADH kinase [Armatimonadetes bacterium]|nr:NAD(+)/NADH kinase [Armatimonadota bacterium]